MKATELPNANAVRPLMFPAPEVPHAVIELNYTCNRRCALCYNRFRTGIKSFAQITAEIELARSKRNLETLSILGGEPTLHPELPAVVRYIKKRGLVCQLLTNGVVLYEDSRQRLLSQLVDARLDRLILHIDSGQGLDSRAVEEMRTTLFDQIDGRGLLFALAVTLYAENLGEIPVLLRRYSQYRYFDGVLATLAENMDNAGCPSEALKPGLREVHAGIATGLGVEPAAYLPSNFDAEEIRWLIYFYYLNARTGVTVAISPRFSRLMRRVYRRFKGKHLFAAALRPSRLWFLVTAAVESALSPARLNQFFRVAARSSRFSELRFQYIVVQQAPRLNPGLGPIEFCYHCPDATIRNGRWAPVCLADRMSPPVGASEQMSAPPWAAGVYGHLEDAA